MNSILLNPEIVAQLRVFAIGPIKLHGYGLIIGLAAAVSIILLYASLSEELRDKFRLELLIPVVVISAVIGGRAAFVLGNLHEYYINPSEIVALWDGGITIFGVIAGGLIGYSFCYYFYVRKKRLPFFLFTDLAVPFVALGQSVGRWGNFINQELYGTPTESQYRMYISPEHRLPGYEEFDHFHPAFLYESIAMLITALILFGLARTSKKLSGSGFFTGLYLILYGGIRLGMERIRIDSSPIAGPFKIADIVSIIFVIVGTGIIMYPSTKHALQQQER